MLTAEILTEPLHGTYEIDGLVVTYTLRLITTADSFTYKVSDGNWIPTATVSIGAGVVLRWVRYDRTTRTHRDHCKASDIMVIR